MTAFINIDFENMKNWARKRKISYADYSDLSLQASVEEMIRLEIRKANRRLPGSMRVHKIVLLYKLLNADDEELTRTGKVRRKFIFQQYRELIDAMCSDKTEIHVIGQVRDKDRHIGTIETKARIITV